MVLGKKDQNGALMGCEVGDRFELKDRPVILTSRHDLKLETFPRIWRINYSLLLHALSSNRGEQTHSFF